MTPPKLLDDLVAKKVVDAVRAGASRTGAAEAARVGRRTLHRWLQRGAAGEAPYAAFLEKIREAEGELEKELVGIIKGHASDTFAAAAWLCERRWPQRWALRRDRLDREPAPPTEAETERLIAEAAELHATRGAK